MLLSSGTLVPKDLTRGLNVLAIGRVSTVHQDIENIKASYRYIQEYLGQIYQGSMDIKLLGEQASGMLTDRATIREAEELVAGGTVDLVIAEDLARIYRNPRHQYNFVQDCVDHGTRVICVGDNLDTSDENWEVTMGAAALRHGLHIPDTRRRVRRTATHCFHKGGMVQKLRFGYRKLTPEEAASGAFGPKDLRIVKVPECTPVVRQMMEHVLRGDRYAAVAQWLEDEGIPPGPHVEGGHWTARIVADLLDDPILSGTRTFRDMVYRPIFKTGRHKPTKNPNPETAFFSELAHLSLEEHNALRREIARRRTECAARGHHQKARSNIPRSRSYWPGQALRCAICGGRLYLMGAYLKCQNSLPGPRQSCWNHVQVSAALVRERTLTWLLHTAEGQGPLRQALVDVAYSEGERRRRQSTRGQGSLIREVAALERQAEHLAAAIAAGGQLETLVRKLRAVEESLQRARATLASRSASVGEAEAGLATKEEVESHLLEALRSLAAQSYEFASWMRRLIPEFVVCPVQSLDCAQVRPRGKLLVRWRAVVEIAGEEEPPEDTEVTLDLFDPPLHVRFLPQCLAARDEHPSLSLKEIARLLGINHMAVKRAFDYARRMEEAGISDPYRELHEPAPASRWKHRVRCTAGV